MKNYWLDRRYPLATAVRDYRKGKDALSMQILEQMFHDLALKILATLESTRRSGKLLDVMEQAAWEHVERFDLRKKPQAVTYFSNVMRSVIPAVPTPADRARINALRRQAIQKSLKRSVRIRRNP